MATPRMNLFRDLGKPGRKQGAPTAPFQFSKPKGIPPGMMLGLAVFGILAFVIYSNQQKHKKRMAEMKTQLGEYEEQIKQVVAMSENVPRKPASKAPLRPSGIDGTWAAVLWKIAAFSGRDIVITSLSLAPVQGSRIQAVTVSAHSTSALEIKRWLERLIENMPGSEFSVQSQHQVDDKEYPIQFNLIAQVI